MKQYYISAKRLSLWMRLTKKWTSLYSKVQETTNLKSLKKLNSLSLFLGVKRKVALTALAGVVTLGAQAQLTSFKHTTEFNLTTVGSGISTPAFGDLDGDGDQDMISGEKWGNFYYVENIGSSTNPVFDEPSKNALGLQTLAPLAYSTPTLADLDNDGDLDIISGANDSTFYYFENTGTASAPAFSAPVANPFNLTNQDAKSQGVFADLDGDGLLDFLTSGASGNFQYFKNIGTATDPDFEASQLNPFDLTKFGLNVTLTLGDVDEDGDLDLFASENRNFLNYYENTGTATDPVFATPTRNVFNLTSLGSRKAPYLVDLDGDTDLDLITGDATGTFFFEENTLAQQKVSVTRESGLRAPAPAPFFEIGLMNKFGIEPIVHAKAEGSPFMYPAVGDLDGDGDLDLLSYTTGSPSKYEYFENIGSESNPDFADGVENPFSLDNTSNPVFPELIDIDNDGDLDLFSASWSGDFLFRENTGTPVAPDFSTAIEANPYDLTSVGTSFEMDFADLDNDGDLDIIVGDYYGNFSYYENTGKGDNPTFASIVENDFSIPQEGNYYNSVSLKDIDKDGDYDLFTMDYDDNETYYENVGTKEAPDFARNFTSGFSMPTLSGYNGNVLADLDNDGDLDVFVGGSNMMYIENTSDFIASTDTTPTTPLTTGIFDKLTDNKTASFTRLIRKGETLRFEETLTSVSVLNIQGIELLQTEQLSELKTSQLHSGVYFIHSAQGVKRVAVID